jgi:hypothetical protein
MGVVTRVLGVLPSSIAQHVGVLVPGGWWV